MAQLFCLERNPAKEEQQPYPRLLRQGYVLVQPEIERGRSPLVSLPPFGAGIFKASIRPPGYPSAWACPRRATSVSPGQIIVAPPCLSVSTSGYPVTMGSAAGHLRGGNVKRLQCGLNADRRARRQGTWAPVRSLGHALQPNHLFHTPTSRGA